MSLVLDGEHALRTHAQSARSIATVPTPLVAIIHGGRLAALGTTAELKRAFHGRTIIEVHAGRPVEAMRLLDDMPDVEKTSVFGTAVHAVVSMTPGEAARTIRERLEGAGVAVTRLGPVEPSLEDVFLDVAERSNERNA